MAMQFVVPQFIEAESKIIGPISVRQFIILLVTAGFIYLGWTVFAFWLAAICGIFFLTVGGTFAFVKINSQPFHIFALGFVQTLKNPNLKRWQREYYVVTKVKDGKENKKKKDGEKDITFVPKAEINKSRLTELSLLVDTGGVYQPEELEKKAQEQNQLRNKN